MRFAVGKEMGPMRIEMIVISRASERKAGGAKLSKGASVRIEVERRVTRDLHKQRCQAIYRQLYCVLSVWHTLMTSESAQGVEQETLRGLKL